MSLQTTRLWLLACLTAWCSGCTQLAFFAANVPARFGSYTRFADIDYGTQARNKLDVYVPHNLSAMRGPVPIVVFFYGGGWNSGDKSYYRFVGAALARQGYIAVLPNYRLYPQVKSTQIFQDAAAAVAFVHGHASEWGGDANQVYLVGHSAGAHIAVMLALNPEYLLAAGASTQDLRGVVGLAGPYNFLPFNRPYMDDLFGPPEKFAASQPINFVRAHAPPLLLLQGLKDQTVDPNNTRTLFAAQQAIGGSVLAKYYDDASHGDMIASFASLARHRVPVLEEINHFIAGNAQRGAASTTSVVDHARFAIDSATN